MADTSKQGKCSAIETQMIFTRSGNHASDFVVGGAQLEELHGPIILGLDSVHQAVYAKWARPHPPRPVPIAASPASALGFSTASAEDFRAARQQVARADRAACGTTAPLPTGEPRALPEVAKVQGASPPPSDDEVEELIQQREQREQQPETQEQQPAAAAQTGASPQPALAST